MKQATLIYYPKVEDIPAVERAITAHLTTIQKKSFEFRRFRGEAGSPIVISSEVPKSDYEGGGRLSITVRPATIESNVFSFSTNHVAALIGPLLDDLHHWICVCLELGETPLAELELSDFRVHTLMIELLFPLKSEAQASKTLLQLAQHAKVVMDMADPMPGKKWTLPKKAKAKVNWKDANGQVLTVELPFGRLRAFVAADGDHAKSHFLHSDDTAERAARLARLRQVVCLEIEAVIRQVTNPSDPTTKLTPELNLWFREEMKLNPYLFIWNAFTAAIWLDQDLTTDETNTASAPLSREQESVLRGYFDGHLIEDHEMIQRNLTRFVEFRRALIKKAGVDLLNQWRHFRLNLATDLRATLQYDSHLKPDKSEFADVTLTPDRAKEAGLALRETKEPGWTTLQ